MNSTGFFYFRFAYKTSAMSIELLYSKFLEKRKVFTDSRLAVDGGIFFALKGDKFDGNKFALQAIADGADYAVVDSDDLKDHEGCIFVPDVLTALQQLAHYYRKQLNIPIVAITGTNGKTTTKELATSVLQQKYNVLSTKGNLNNHIGVPLTLLSISNEHQIAIVEMGANHPGEIEFLCKIAEPDFGLITNVGKAHLEGFGSFEGVKKTKGELYDFIAQQGKGIFINADNEHLVSMSEKNLVKFTYGVENEKADLKGMVANSEVQLVARVLFPKGWLYIKSNLTGNYNLENILAAARIGLHFQVDPLLIQKGIENYVPLNNRSQITKKRSNLLLVDCYNANPTSMDVSLSNFESQGKAGKIVILGDMLELGSLAAEEHQKIVDRLAFGTFEMVFLVGSHFLEANTPQHFLCVENADELKPYIEKAEFEDKFILIKGSRGTKLEKVIEWI